VPAHQLELLVGERAFFVEQRRRQRKFANVMEERAPIEHVTIVPRQAHFFADQCGVSPHSFGVAARLAVVDGQGGNELEDADGGLSCCLPGSPPGLGFGQAAAKLVGRACPQSGAEARRGAVGEDQRQGQQQSER
jgi:hypothetical protein